MALANKARRCFSPGSTTGNVSALIAFGLMVGLALAGRHSPEHLYIWTLLLIGGLPLLGFASLATAC